MLWHKTWLDTRARFLTGFVLMVCATVAIVAGYPAVMRLVDATPNVNADSALGKLIQERIALSRSFRGYLLTQWFMQTPIQLGTLFAVLLGSGGLLSKGSREAALFTLSLPVSRERLVGTRAVVGIAELLAIAIASSLLLPLAAPSVGQSFGAGESLVHGLSLLAGWSIFFGLALAFSTVWDDIWRPMLFAIVVALVLGFAEMLLPDLRRFGVFAFMSGETFFRTGQLPWIGWMLGVAATGALVWGAMVNFGNREF